MDLSILDNHVAWEAHTRLVKIQEAKTVIKRMRWPLGSLACHNIATGPILSATSATISAKGRGQSTAHRRRDVVTH